MKTRADPKQRRPGHPSGYSAGTRAGAGAEERGRRAARALRRHALQDRESHRQVDEFLQRNAGASG